MTENVKFVRRDLVAAEVEGDLILFDAESGNYFNTSDVGVAIWTLLASPLSMDELCLRLSQEYEVSPDECKADVVEFVEKMKEEGLAMLVDHNS